MNSLSPVLLLATLLVLTKDTISQETCYKTEVGAIRLTYPRNSSNEGAVQMCTSFIRGGKHTSWVYYSPNGWDRNDSEVVCRQLGNPYEGATAASTSLHFVPNIFNEPANCSGREDNLRDCFKSHTVNMTQTTEVATVICKCKAGEIRLVDGANYREGRVEVCVDGRWGTVCREGWRPVYTNEVCGRLGFSRNGTSLIPVGNGTGQIHTLTCSSSDDCTTTPAQNCHHGMVGVRCLAQQDVVCTTDDNDSPAGNNTTTVALGVVTALLILVVLIIAVGWILTCVFFIRKRSIKTVNITSTASSSDRCQMDNPTYNGTVTRPQEQTQYSSLGPAYEFIANANSTHNYDVISQQLPRQQATPNGSHDPPAEHDYHVLEHSKSGSQSNPQDYETPMPTGN